MINKRINNYDNSNNNSNSNITRETARLVIERGTDWSWSECGDRRIETIG